MNAPAGGGLSGRAALVRAVWRTWGARGLARRSAYEVDRRSGRLRSAEDRWLRTTGVPPAPLAPAGTTVPSRPSGPDPTRADPGGRIRLYGALDVDLGSPPEWHRHPLTGHRYPSDVHWSDLDDSGRDGGDIKDIWEPSRLGWLQPMVRSWAATGDDAVAESVWGQIEHWYRRNPAYLGPNWMCGQETSLRTISVLFVADVMAASPATTPARRQLVADMVQDAVGRVAPTLSYALSQRNNHATSEAGFLWTASVLAPWLPDAAKLQRRSAHALTEITRDQFAADGSYAQHAPTYQRVALHVLLWCLSVARANSIDAPPGVADAVEQSVGHLRSLLVPGSDGQMPNLGGNDGALVFDLSTSDIGDFRPVLAHAAAATGATSGLGAGPWDEEARWFDLEAMAEMAEADPVGSPSGVTVRRGVDTHALTAGRAHVVLRAGSSRHRPAHADQLHVDLWLAGRPVAVDPGVYRYSAPAPWDNALADEAVHNLVRRPGVAQAVRANRFFWLRWSEASIDRLAGLDAVAYGVARLELVDGTVLRRLVAVADGMSVVVDWMAVTGNELRWNLPGDAQVDVGHSTTTVIGAGWKGRIVHSGPVTVPSSDDADPASGWESPTYAFRRPVTAVVVGPEPVGTVVSAFALSDRASELTRIAAAAQVLDPSGVDDTSIAALFDGG